MTDEDLALINSSSRNEKIKNFFINNKKVIILIISFLILLVFSFYFFEIFKNSKKEQISDKYNSALIKYNDGENTEIILAMKEVIKDNDSTYSPLALYFLIDKGLIKEKNEINRLFDIVLNKTSLEEEIKNLVIYKKALYNADFANENELMNILDPIIKSKSIWKSHALYLLAEFFYSNSEKQKAKEFFEYIIELENSNQDIKIEAQKRLNRDLSD